MQNYSFSPLYDHVPRELQGSGPAQFYQQFREELLAHALRTSNQKVGPATPSTEHNRCFAELEWYKNQKPFYRIENSIIDLFGDVDLQLPCEYVRAPYPCFAVQFALDNPLRGAHGRQVRSMLVHSCLGDHGQETFNLWVDLGEKDTMCDTLPLLNYLHMVFDEGKLISDCVQEFPLDESGSDPPTNDLDYTLTRLAISICFLATSSDKLIRPDILSKDLDKYLRAVRQGDTTQQKTIVERSHRRKGYRLIAKRVGISLGTVRLIAKGKRDHLLDESRSKPPTGYAYCEKREGIYLPHELGGVHGILQRAQAQPEAHQQSHLDRSSRALRCSPVSGVEPPAPTLRRSTCSRRWPTRNGCPI